MQSKPDDNYFYLAARLYDISIKFCAIVIEVERKGERECVWDDQIELKPATMIMKRMHQIMAFRAYVKDISSITPDS